jgi:hypothetical protein
MGDRAIEFCPESSGHPPLLLGDIATHPDRFDVESGEAYYRKALALAEPGGMRPLIAHCYLGLGKLYRARTSASRPTSTSPLRRRCTARWTCGSGWSRRRRRWLHTRQ